METNIDTLGADILGITAFAGFWIIFFIFMFFIFAVCVVGYLLQAISLFKMAKSTNNDLAWLAWIPIANMYLMITIPKQPFNMLGGKIHFDDRNSAAMMYFIYTILGSTIFSMVSGVLLFIPILGELLDFLLYICFIVFAYLMMYSFSKDLFDTFAPEKNNSMMAILGLFIPFVRVIYMFTLRNNVAQEKVIIVE